MADRFKSFEEFWPYYLNEHSKKSTRNIHVAGTGAAVVLLGAAVVTGQWWLPAAAVAAGYGSAWTAHAFIEKNKPATFKYPLWSLRGDFKMLKHFVTGTLDKEVDKHVRKNDIAVPASPSKSFQQRMHGLTQRFKNAVTPQKKPKPAVPQPKPPVP